jgi:DNA-binding NarL/FixJ family response regulator
MSSKTASVHVTHILEKLGVHTRVQAAAFAARHGMELPADQSVPVTSR